MTRLAGSGAAVGSTRAPGGRLRRATVVVVLTVVAAIGSAAAAAAHPLGNFTTNTSAALTVAPGRLTVDYVVDLAEIPALRARQDDDLDGDGVVGPRETRTAAAGRCAELAGRLDVTVAGRPVALAAVGSSLAFPPGQAGLSTLRLECRLRARIDLRDARTVVFRDGAFADRQGWREIVAVGDGATLTASDVPATSATARLTSYPADGLSAPTRVLTATLTARPDGAADATRSGAGATAGRSAAGAGAVPASARGVDRLTAAFTDLVAERDLTPGFALFAVLVALVLGAAHAVAPGHGKAVMAAYVVGQRGTARQALAIGVTVALTHTAGIVVLGLALSASEALVPETLYPWFGAVSGALIMLIGIGLLRRALRARSHAARTPASAGAVAHVHGRRVHDAHADGGHAHGGNAHVHVVPAQGLRRRDLLTLGFAGGLVPSPSALVVLLGALALGRAAFGLVLVLAYGVGLAATLVAAGLLLLRFRGVAERVLLRPGRVRLRRLVGAAPLVTSALVVLGGAAVVTRGVLLG